MLIHTYTYTGRMGLIWNPLSFGVPSSVYSLYTVIRREEEEIWLLLLLPTQLLYSESLEEPGELGEGGDVEPCHWSILTPHCVVCQKRGDFWWRRSMNLSVCAPHTLGSYQFGIYFHSSYFKGIHVPNFSSLLLDS